MVMPNQTARGRSRELREIHSGDPKLAFWDDVPWRHPRSDYLRPERPFTGVSGPSGPEIPKESQKESFGGSAKTVPENTRKGRKYPKKSSFGCFFSTSSSGIFGDFFADPQKDSF